MRVMRSNRLLQRLWRSWLYEVTRPGKYMIAALLFAAGGVFSVEFPIYHVFCVLAVLASVSLVTGLLFRRKLRLDCRMPDRATADEPIKVPVTVTNRSRWAALDIGLGLFGLPSGVEQRGQDRTLFDLAAGAATEVDLELQPLRRGIYALPDLRAYTLFPFRFLRLGCARRALGSFLVLPSFRPAMGIDVPIGSRYQPGGIALTSHVGESPEYIGNREYIAGESARRLDFRSWARLGKPVVREYQEEYYCRVALILDTFMPRGRKPPGGFPSLEAAVSLTATVADVLSDGEYLVDLFAAGPELYVFRAGRHTAHFENILEILACVEACHDNPFERIAPAVADELQNISTAICVFLDWDRSRQEFARAVLEAGCRLKVLVVRDDNPTLPLDGSEGDFSQYTIAQVRDGGWDIL